MRIRIGDLLVKAGVITDAQLKQALAEQGQWGGKLGDILVRMEFVTEEVLVRALSKQSGIPRADLSGETPRGALEKIAPEMAEEFGLVPLQLQDDGRTLVVAMSDPLNIMVTDHLRSMTGCRVVAQIAGTQAIRDAISRWYRGTALTTDTDPSSIRIINNAGGAVTVTSAGQNKPASQSGLRPVLQPAAQTGLKPPSGAGATSIGPTSNGLKPPSSSGLTSRPPSSSGVTSSSARPASSSNLGSVGAKPPSSSGLRSLPPSVGPGSNSALRSMPPPPPPSSSPGVPVAASSPSAVDVLRGVEDTQRRSVAALKAMVELLIEKGVFSRDEYLGRVKR